MQEPYKDEDSKGSQVIEAYIFAIMSQGKG